MREMSDTVLPNSPSLPSLPKVNQVSAISDRSQLTCSEFIKKITISTTPTIIMIP